MIFIDVIVLLIIAAPVSPVGITPLLLDTYLVTPYVWFNQSRETNTARAYRLCEPKSEEIRLPRTFLLLTNTNNRLTGNMESLSNNINI